MSPRSRFSRRHLLALSTFLVPLAVLAVLGGSELRRSGDLAQTALVGEAKQFLLNARQEIRHSLDQSLSALLRASETSLLPDGPVIAALRLREDPQFAAVRCIVMMDDQANLVLPSVPQSQSSLPFAEDPHSKSDNPTRAALAAADGLLTDHQFQEAIGVLQHVVSQVETANPPPSRGQRPELEEIEIMARFRLATAYLRTGQQQLVGPLLERVLGLVRSRRRFSDTTVTALGLLAEAMQAELGTPEQRLDLLRAIAEGQREQADGLLNAVALRMAATFDVSSPAYAEVQRRLVEDAQRSATRTFAATYEFLMKNDLRRQLQGSSPDGDPPRQMRLVATPKNGRTSLVCVRPATNEEADLWLCAYVGIQVDLGLLLGPTFARFSTPDNTFVLAVDDPDRIPIVPPPAEAPPEFEPPMLETNDLTLRAFPADPARLVADAAAAVQQRTLLLIALFVAALGGALWSWRSVSREAELAALKIDLVSRVSHELKTPLALIRMYGETLGMGRARDGNQAAEFGSIIARESDRLTTLIQRILDYSRQQAGTLHYAPHQHDLGELLRTIADAYAPHLESRGVMLIDDLPHGLVVQCDASACESAVVNLLENAAKYGRDGEGEQEIELVLRAIGGQAVIEVRDHGRGIPEAERERVFEGFYRASNSGEVRGAGLGLSLVRHFAQAHDGRIEALANAGGGTIMRLSLPLLQTAKESPAAASRTGATLDVSGDHP